MNSKIIRGFLSLVGVLGIGVTSWLSVKCSKRADTETDKKKKVLAYAPAIASGVISAGCVLGSNHLANGEIAALAAGAAYMAKKKGANVKSLLPSKQDDEIAPWEKPSIEWTGKGTTLCLEAYSGRFFYSSREEVEKAQEKLNEKFVTGEHICFNDYYELLGIEKTGFGAQYGWKARMDYCDGPMEFYNLEDPNTNMLVCELFTLPMEYWEED